MSDAIPGSATLRAAFTRHLCEDVLGWWLARAPDDELGGVFTCWDNRGKTLLSWDKYTWSQGRWVWLMARLAGASRAGLLPLNADDCLRRATATAVFLRDHATLADGSLAYVTDRAGTPKPPPGGGALHASVFADLFVALGFAALARETGEAEWAGRAEALLVQASASMAAGTAPTEPYPVPTGFVAFSLPMILVGVGTEVHAATGSARSADIVRGAHVAIQGRFKQGNDILEMVPERAEDGDTLLARHRTPGHILEACWFLQHAGKVLGEAPPGSLLDPRILGDIAVRACETGWDAAHGGLLRYVGAAGGAPEGRRLGGPYETLVAGTWGTKLWWPHAEALYATLLFGLAERPDLITWHERIRDYTLATFPAGPGQEWIQIRDRAGAPLDVTVALPVKDPFHIARALLLLVELLSPDGA